MDGIPNWGFPIVSTAPVARPLDPDWLERQLLVRGWGIGDLCDHARLSRTTASNARAGRRVDGGTVLKIAAAFRANPPDPQFAEIAGALR